MMRISFTRLVDSITRTVLLVPCLLICLACATPFPFDKLEEGMTAESVRKEFGAPKAEEAVFAWSGGATSCWTYWHEEQDWIATSLLPFAWIIVIPGHALAPGHTWDAWFLVRNSVFLHFQEEKLLYWEATEPIMEDYPDVSPVFVRNPDGTQVLSAPNVWETSGTQSGPSTRDPPKCKFWYGNSPPKE